MNYFTEDGHYWNREELTQFAQFKINEMLDQDYTYDEIIGFDDSDLWKKTAHQIIVSFKRNL